MDERHLEKKSSDGLRALFIVVGAVVTIGAVAATLYALFKKYFKITFENDCGDCCDCFEDSDDDVECNFCGCDDDEEE